MSKIGRRRLLAGGGTGVGRPAHCRPGKAPALAANDRERVLRFVPQVDLVSLDPHYSMTNVTRIYAGLVFYELYEL